MKALFSSRKSEMYIIPYILNYFKFCFKGYLFQRPVNSHR